MDFQFFNDHPIQVTKNSGRRKTLPCFSFAIFSEMEQSPKFWNSHLEHRVYTRTAARKNLRARCKDYFYYYYYFLLKDVHARARYRKLTFRFALLQSKQHSAGFAGSAEGVPDNSGNLQMRPRVSAKARTGLQLRPQGMFLQTFLPESRSRSSRVLPAC